MVAGGHGDRVDLSASVSSLTSLIRPCCSSYRTKRLPYWRSGLQAESSYKNISLARKLTVLIGLIRHHKTRSAVGKHHRPIEKQILRASAHKPKIPPSRHAGLERSKRILPNQRQQSHAVQASAHSSLVATAISIRVRRRKGGQRTLSRLLRASVCANASILDVRIHVR